jgi:hypothetical protein
MAVAPLEPTNLELVEGKDYMPRERKLLPTPPQRIVPVPMLKVDLLALATLFNVEMPGQILLGASQVYTILYGYVNVSGSDFGSMVMVEGGIRIGTRGAGKEETSNFREFENVVDALREEALAGIFETLSYFCSQTTRP